MEKHSPRAKKPGRKHTGAHRTGNRSSSAMKSKAVLHKRWLLGTVAAVREAQARQRAASGNNRRRSRDSWTVGGPRSASAIARSLKGRPPLLIVLFLLALL